MLVSPPDRRCTAWVSLRIGRARLLPRRSASAIAAAMTSTVPAMRSRRAALAAVWNSVVSLASCSTATGLPE